MDPTEEYWREWILYVRFRVTGISVLNEHGTVFP